MRNTIGLAARQPLAATFAVLGVVLLFSQAFRLYPDHRAVAAGVLLLIVAAAGLADHDSEGTDA